MDPALAGLAGAAGAALIEAMTTDLWGTTKARLARIVGRSTPTTEESVARELEESAQRLNRSSPPDPADLEAEQERWTVLLAAFLVEHVEATTELQKFLHEVRRSLDASDAGDVVQNITVGRNAFIAGRDQHISMPMDDDGR